MRKKNGAGGIRVPDFKQYYKAIVIKTVWYWHTKKQIYRSLEQDRKPRDKPVVIGFYLCTCGHLIYDKGGKNILRRKDSLFNKWCWETGYCCCSVTKLCFESLCKPMDYSLPASSVHEVFQVIILEWVAISLSRETV